MVSSTLGVGETEVQRKGNDLLSIVQRVYGNLDSQKNIPQFVAELAQKFRITHLALGRRLL